MTRRVYPTPFVLRPPDDLPATWPHLARAAAELAHIYAKHDRVVSDEALAAIGGALWSALAAADPTLPERFDAARAAAGTFVLPLVVESGTATVQLLPWEALAHPTHGFLGRAPGFTLSRRLPGPAPDHGPPDDVQALFPHVATHRLHLAGDGRPAPPATLVRLMQAVAVR